MSKSQKLFRYVWRINAVLILLAALLITLTVGAFLAQDLFRAMRRRDPDVRLSIPDSNPKARLSLSRASQVRGTNVMRAELQGDSDGGKFSSSYGKETRNILFIEPGNKKGRWLLPDNDHVITENNDFTQGNDSDEKRVLATAVVVRPTQQGSDPNEGKLILFDAVGRNIVDVANNVQEIHIASVAGNELTILFERENRLVYAAFDARSLSKLREQEIEVPGF